MRTILYWLKNRRVAYRLVILFVLMTLSVFIFIQGSVPNRATLIYFVFMSGLAIVNAIMLGKSRGLTNLTLLVFTTAGCVSGLDVLMRLSHKQMEENNALEEPRPPHVISKKLREDIPFIKRYTANSSFSGYIYGDLADLSNHKEDRHIRRIVFHTDKWGYRNSGDENNDVDIIIVGDSVGAGTGTSQEKIFSSLLEKEYGYNSYNLSVSAFSLWDGYATLIRELPRIPVNKSTNICWIVFSGNDFDDEIRDDIDYNKLERLSVLNKIQWNIEHYRMESPLRKRLIMRDIMSEKSILRRVITRKVLNFNVLFYSIYVHRSMRHSDVIEHSENYRRMKDLILEMKRYCLQKKLGLLIYLVPTKAEVYSWVLAGREAWTPSLNNEPYSFLSTFCKDNGIKFYEMTPYLISASRRLFLKEKQLLYWSDDTHPNDFGNAEIARFIHYTLHTGYKPNAS